MYVLPLLFSVLFHLFVFFLISTFTYDPHIITKPQQVPIKVYLVEITKHIEVKQAIVKSQIKKPSKVVKGVKSPKKAQQRGSKLIANAFRQLSVENSKEGIYNRAVILQKIDPVYPALARRNLWEGRVVIRIHISTEGICDSATIAQSSGHEVLDKAALQSVYHWRFKPAQEGKRVIGDTLLVPFIFDLVR